jgi:hypothetical protein
MSDHIWAPEIVEAGVDFAFFSAAKNPNGWDDEPDSVEYEFLKADGSSETTGSLLAVGGGRAGLYRANESVGAEGRYALWITWTWGTDTVSFVAGVVAVASGHDPETVGDTIDAVKAKTDGLPADPASESAITGGEGDTLAGIADAVGALLDVGDGSVVVNHDTGGADALRYVTDEGAGIDNAVIRAYLKSDYDAGDRGEAFVRATSTTDSSGRWARDMRLDPGTYVLEFTAQGRYGPDTEEVTVS